MSGAHAGEVEAEASVGTTSRATVASKATIGGVRRFTSGQAYVRAA
jgi:hypothetical protein